MHLISLPLTIFLGRCLQFKNMDHFHLAGLAAMGFSVTAIINALVQVNFRRGLR